MFVLSQIGMPIYFLSFEQQQQQKKNNRKTTSKTYFKTFFPLNFSTPKNAK